LIESNLLIFKFIIISIKNQLLTLKDKLKFNLTLTFLTFYAQQEQTISLHYSHYSLGTHYTSIPTKNIELAYKPYKYSGKFVLLGGLSCVKVTCYICFSV